MPSFGRILQKRVRFYKQKIFSQTETNTSSRKSDKENNNHRIHFSQ